MHIDHDLLSIHNMHTPSTLNSICLSMKLYTRPMVRHGQLTSLSSNIHVGGGCWRHHQQLFSTRYYELFLLYSFIKGDYFPALATTAHGTITSAIPNMFERVL